MTNHKVFLSLAYAVFVLIFGVLTVLFWPFVSDRILVPVYYFLWVLGLLINSIPQGIYLALLVIFSAITAAKILENLRTSQRQRQVIFNPSNTSTRYWHWRTLCVHSYGNWFSKGRLAYEARHLILSILAFEYGVDLSDAEAMVRDGTIELSETLRNVINMTTIPDAPPHRFTGILSWLSRSVRWADSQSDPYVEQLLTELMNFLEYHLEITPHAGNEF